MKHTIKVIDLIEVLQENLSEHRAIFEQAVENYHKAAVERLNNELLALNANKRHHIMISMPVPEDHSEDYERIIRMLHFALEAGQTVMELSDEEARMYVQDDWDWRRAWAANTVSYVQS